MDSSSSSSDEYEYLRPNPLPGGPSAYTFVPESEWNSICEDVLSGGDWRRSVNNSQQHSTSLNGDVDGTSSQINNEENVTVNMNPMVLKPDLYSTGNDVNANSSGSDLLPYSSNVLVTNPECNVGESSRDKRDLDVTQEHKNKVSNKPFKKDMDCQTVITGDIISLNLHNLEDGDAVLTPTIETSYNENLMRLDCISLDDIQNIFINQGNVFLDYINSCDNENISKSCVTVNDEGMSGTESVGRLSEGEGLQSANLVEPVVDTQDEQQEVEMVHFVSSELHLNDKGMGSSESISHLSNNEIEDDLERSCVATKLVGNIRHGDDNITQLYESLIMKHCHNNISGHPNKDEIEVDSMSNSETMGDSNITDLCNRVTEHNGSESNIVSQNESAYSRDISVQINRNACNSSDNVSSLQTIDNCSLSDRGFFHVADTNVGTAELLDNDFCCDFNKTGSNIHSQNKSVEDIYRPTCDAVLSDESMGNPAVHTKDIVENARDVASLCKYCSGFNSCVSCGGSFQDQYNDFMLSDTRSTVGSSQIVTLPIQDPKKDVNITDLLDKVPSTAHDQTEYPENYAVSRGPNAYFRFM